MPFNEELLTGLAIYPAQLPAPTESDKIEYDYTDRGDISRFLSGINFSETIDGTGLGADYDAYVFLRFGEEVAEYRICADFDYFLAKDDWENMYEILWDLKQELRALEGKKLRKY